MKDKGFLMMDLLFSLLALTALAAIMGLYAQGERMAVSAANLTTAAALAEKQAAFLRSGCLPRQGQTSFPWLDKNDLPPLYKNNSEFTVRTTMQPAAGERRIDAAEIVVSWREFSHLRQIQLTTAVIFDE